MNRDMNKLLLSIMLLAVIGITTQSAFADQTKQWTENIPLTQNCHVSSDVKYNPHITFTTTYHYVTYYSSQIGYYQLPVVTGSNVSIDFPQDLTYCYIEYGTKPQFMSLDVTFIQDGNSCKVKFTSNTDSTTKCTNINTLHTLPIGIMGTLIYDLGGPFKETLDYSINVGNEP